MTRRDLVARICGAVDSGPPCMPLSAGASTAKSDVALWVQIPSIGGGYHDLVVGSWGISTLKLITVVQDALPNHVVAAEAGHPPWSVLPVCAPEQAPDADAASAQACFDT